MFAGGGTVPGAGGPGAFGVGNTNIGLQDTRSLEDVARDLPHNQNPPQDEIQDLEPVGPDVNVQGQNPPETETGDTTEPTPRSARDPIGVQVQSLIQRLSPEMQARALQLVASLMGQRGQNARPFAPRQPQSSFMQGYSNQRHNPVWRPERPVRGPAPRPWSPVPYQSRMRANVPHPTASYPYGAPQMPRGSYGG